MVSEILLSTIFTASVAGAGLLIAILTLISQLRSSIFEKRLATARHKSTEFDRTRDSITPKEVTKKTEQLKELGYIIQSMKSLPTYLTSWVKLVLLGFVITAFFSLFWLTDAVDNPQAEFVLLLLFSLSTLGFFGVVWGATQDIIDLMKEEFEQLKREQEEMETQKKQIEDFQKHLPEDNK
jgi:pilus assembly protein TadC